jgi:hypothetical protein
MESSFMNKSNKLKNPKLTSKRRLPIYIVSVLFMIVGAYFLTQTYAGSNLIYVSPATANKYVGETFSVQVRITAGSKINAAFVNMTYNANGLQVTNIQRGADFPNQNAPTQHTVNGNTGTIKMESTRNKSSTGNFHYATITFKAKSTGTYSLIPSTSSSLIDYGGAVPFNAYSIASGRFTFTNKPTPPAPTPAPKPAPTPAPVPPPTTPSVSVPVTESPPSPSNLVISDLNISEVGYNSGVVTWTTNKPATSKVNYGPTTDDMPNEVSDEEQKTEHRIALEGEAILAGNSYAIRVTSNDGNGPATLDAEFTTRSIGIIVVVKDSQDLPVEGATVSTGTDEEQTDAEGRAVFVVAEGDIVISATKDDLYGEMSAQIVVPESDNESPQQIDITIGDEFEVVTEEPVAEDGGGSIWIFIVPLFLLLAGFIFFVIRRRRKTINNSYVPEPYAPEPAVNLQPETPDMSQVHHATLPELVSQGIAANKQKATTTPTPPTPAVAPHVAVPATEAPAAPQIVKHSPPQAETPPKKNPPAQKPAEQASQEALKPAETTKKTHKTQDSESDQGVLRIDHD